MTAIEAELAKIKASATKVETNTEEILSIFNSWKGAMRVLGWLGAVFKWASLVGSPLGALYWWMKTGELPKGK